MDKNVASRDNLYNFGIIGSGPAGYETALKLKKAGYSVCLIEKNEIGGVCLNSGCIPTKVMVSAAHKFSELNNLKRYGIRLDREKKFEYYWFRNFQKSVISRLKKGLENSIKNTEIDFIKGRAEIKNNNTITVFCESGNFEINFGKLIIATGSRPFVPKNWMDIKGVFDSENFWKLDTIPKSVAIIGGGVIGCEYASSLADLGYNVVLIEKIDRLLITEEKEVSDAIFNELKAKGVKIFLGAVIENIENVDDKVNLFVGDGLKPSRLGHEHQRLMDGEGLKPSPATVVDIAVCCMGRVRNLDDLGLENIGITNFDVNEIKDFKIMKNVYVIGDVARGPQLAHKGYYDAEILTENLISDKKIEIDYENIPMSVFTNPEISRVGLIKEKLVEKFGDENIQQVRVNFAEIGKAVAENAIKGFLLMNIIKSTGKIAGISIFGSNASEFCACSSIIISRGLTVNDIKDISFSHPTVSEIFKVAVERV